MAARAPAWKKHLASLPGSPASLSLYPRVMLVAFREIVTGNMATMLMEMEGSLVLSASHGWEALEVSRSFKGTIDIVVADADLPGLGCADLCRRLLEERPGIKVLVLSTAGSASFDAGTLRAKVRAIAAARALSFPYVYMMFPGNPPAGSRLGASLGREAEDRQERRRHSGGIEVAVC